MEIFAIRTYLSNIYIIKKGKTLIVIDAGYSKFQHKEFNKIEVHLENISAVLLTHSDFDHAGGVKFFLNNKIYLAKDEIPLTDGSTYRKFWVKNKSLRGRSFESFENGEVLHINDINIKTIVVPGHTPGSTCYLVEGKYLFTGDCFNINHQQISTFYWIVNMNTKQQRVSLMKLKKFLTQNPIERIFTAHRGIYKIKNMKFLRM